MEKPNIIMIMTDQQRFDTINSHGYKYMITPNIDKLSEYGTSFTSNFVCGATCVASRAAAFTGMYPHNTGVYSFYNWSHIRSWIHDLKDNGYYTVNIGKMHIQPFDDPYDFDDRIICENPSWVSYQRGNRDDDYGKFLRYFGDDKVGLRHQTDPSWRKKFQAVPWHLEEFKHPDVFVGNSALGWINKHNMKKDEPVFLQIGFTGPHEPYSPPERILEMYKDAKLPKWDKLEGELDTKPPQHKGQQRMFNYNNEESQIAIPNATEPDIDNMKRHYYASITTIDEKIGEIIDALRERGFLDNAIVILTSDHGDLLGDHFIPYKWLMYDPIVRTPLVIWNTNKGKGKSIDNLVSHIDIGPTILDYAGIDIPPYFEGESLRNIVDNDEKVKLDKEYVFAEDTYLTMIRSKSYKLVYYTDQGENGELYDLKNDPKEYVNLFNNSDYLEIKGKMKNALLDWLLKSNYYTCSYKTKDLKAPWHCAFDKRKNLLAADEVPNAEELYNDN